MELCDRDALDAHNALLSRQDSFSDAAAAQRSSTSPDRVLEEGSDRGTPREHQREDLDYEEDLARVGFCMLLGLLSLVRVGFYEIEPQMRGASSVQVKAPGSALLESAAVWAEMHAYCAITESCV